MPELRVEFEVWCSCGEGLCGQTTTKLGRSGPEIVIEPCSKCKDLAYKTGYNKGYDEGYGDREE